VPTIFSERGFRVCIFVRDEHPPPHVHVEHAGTFIPVLIALDGASWRGDYRGRRPREAEIRGAVALVERRLQYCLFQWNRYHPRRVHHDEG
jgi:hypothetical protein